MNKILRIQELPLKDLDNMKRNTHKNYSTVKRRCNHCKQKWGRNVVSQLNSMKFSISEFYIVKNSLTRELFSFFRAAARLWIY